MEIPSPRMQLLLEAWFRQEVAPLIVLPGCHPLPRYGTPFLGQAHGSLGIDSGRFTITVTATDPLRAWLYWLFQSKLGPSSGEQMLVPGESEQWIWPVEAWGNLAIKLRLENGEL